MQVPECVFLANPAGQVYIVGPYVYPLCVGHDTPAEAFASWGQVLTSPCGKSWVVCPSGVLGVGQAVQAEDIEHLPRGAVLLGRSGRVVQRDELGWFAAGSSSPLPVSGLDGSTLLWLPPAAE